jgi:esterase
MVDRLIVVDIAPRRYPRSHEEIFDALRSLKLEEIESRGDAEEALRTGIKERSIRQFLLKNLRRTKENGFTWKMNLAAIYDHYEDILAAVGDGEPFKGPVLFIRGARSHYIRDEDRMEIEKLFPNARIETVKDAGHWVHADAPDKMLRLIRNFLGK